MYNNWLHYESTPWYRGYPQPYWNGTVLHTQAEQSEQQTDGEDFIQELQEQINRLKAQQIAVYDQMVTQYLRNQLNARIGEIQKDLSTEKVFRYFHPQ
jgi:hypothetical protein